MPLIDCAQRSTEWMLTRHGKVTASRMDDVLAALKKGGESQARYKYKIELIAEMLTGKTADKFVTDSMQWGTDQEPYARALYEIKNDVMVEQVGLFIHPTIERFAASPDGLVGKDGMVEIKCPTTATHLTWLLAGVTPEEYEPQMVAQMACSGRSWNQFISYDPRLPEHLQLFQPAPLQRNETRIAEIETAVVNFLTEVDTLLEQLNERR